MKTVAELIEELSLLPQDLPVFHFDDRGKLSHPKTEESETLIDGEPYKYVMLTSSELTEYTSEESEIND